MTDEPIYTEFGDHDKLLAFLKEKSDDIEKAVIPQTPTLLIKQHGLPTMELEVGMVLHMSNGHNKYINPKDAEILLNDGILNRM